MSLNKKQEQQAVIISETMWFLAGNRTTPAEQRKLQLLSMAEYLDDGANHLAGMWVRKEIDHENYHLLMNYYRSAWNILVEILNEDYEAKIFKENYDW